MNSEQYNDAVRELMTKMADDALVIGHRNSEWIGLGPVLEEDIAFGSLAQDKTGHAYNLYVILHEMGEPEPDTMAFLRNENEYKCCHLVEYPIGEYDFSLLRHFLFDNAEYLRYEMLINSSFQPLANLARKYKAEIKYHIFHANTWIKQLGGSNEIAHSRMQTVLDSAFKLANSIFEPGPFEHILQSENIFAGEALLREKWLEMILPVIEKANLRLPDLTATDANYGGRKGNHTKFLPQLLDEMSIVFKSEEGVEW